MFYGFVLKDQSSIRHTLAVKDRTYEKVERRHTNQIGVISNAKTLEGQLQCFILVAGTVVIYSQVIEWPHSVIRCPDVNEQTISLREE